MRLLWICGSAVVGGAESSGLQLTALLARRGHEVACLCRRGGAVERLVRGADLPVRPAALGGALNLLALHSVARALADFAPDVALVTTADEWVWACLARPARRAARIVLVRYMALPLPRRVQRLAGRRADAIVAVSEAVRRSLLHVDPRRVHLVRLPWRLPPRDSIASAEEREGARARLGLPRGRRWVGFFGGLRPAKGVFDVLEAIGCLPEGLAGVHLFVCGPGGDARQRDQAAAAAARLGLQGRVHLLGWVPDVVAALVAADVVVVATRSRLAEALPLVLLDAMACGTPVVASAVGGVAEAIGRDGEAGRLARADDPTDLGRALGEALADANAAAAMAARALRRLRESFDPEAAADRYEDLFRRLGVPLSPA